MAQPRLAVSVVLAKMNLFRRNGAGRSAAMIAAIGFVGIAVFQLALPAGMPWGHAAWGGAQAHLSTAQRTLAPMPSRPCTTSIGARQRKERAMATFWTIVSLAFAFGVPALVIYALVRMFTAGLRAH